MELMDFNSEFIEYEYSSYRLATWTKTKQDELLYTTNFQVPTVPFAKGKFFPTYFKDEKDGRPR